MLMLMRGFNSQCHDKDATSQVTQFNIQHWETKKQLLLEGPAVESTHKEGTIITQ